ncbi:MAG: Fic family protein [Blautia sp.]|nr:Fic family protein [Lachnoclostridium sp.]MCM1210156.1 Fic family protein [Blautia sp.]
MAGYEPPFHMTNSIINLLMAISEQLGRITVLQPENITPHLRKENRIRTIHASLAIEHNSLSVEQMTAIINGKRVLGNPNEIKEVQNAYQAYELMLKLNPYSVEDLLNVHRLMMQDLIGESGKFRSGAVGVYEGEKIIHVAPPAKFVSGLIKDLMKWYQGSDLQPLVKSAIFHYEFEFIHPFADGNGRMGRLWHTVLLGQWKELFYWLPIESLICARQDEYYKALGKADKDGDSSEFVQMMLQVIHDTLIEYENTTDQENDQETDQVKMDNPRVNKLLEVMGNRALSAVEIMEELGLSHRPTFRNNYLNPALELGVIEKTIPDKPNSRNQRYRKKI